MSAPIPMLLHCPLCAGKHIDEGEFAHKPHHTHACQHCGHVWRPAIVHTVGVQFLPGYKNITMSKATARLAARVLDRHPVRINNCSVCRAIIENDGSGHEAGCPEDRK